MGGTVVKPLALNKKPSLIPPFSFLLCLGLNAGKVIPPEVK